MQLRKALIDDLDWKHPLFSNAALLISHPGHELCVYGWAEKVRPRVFVLTDGSGHSGKGRLASTSKVLEQINCDKGAIYGPFSDADVYAAMLRHDFQFFIELSEQLCAALIRARIDLVVGDAGEWYSSTHDVWRLTINAAVEMANRDTGGLRVANYDFPIVGKPESGDGFNGMSLQLSDQVFKKKIAAARSYGELDDSIEFLFERFGTEAFAVEYLRLVPTGLNAPIPDAKPFYEVYGENQVAAGYYKQVIRHDQHILPLAEALQDHSRRSF